MDVAINFATKYGFGEVSENQLSILKKEVAQLSEQLRMKDSEFDKIMRYKIEEHMNKVKVDHEKVIRERDEKIRLLTLENEELKGHFDETGEPSLTQIYSDPSNLVEMDKLVDMHIQRLNNDTPIPSKTRIGTSTNSFLEKGTDDQFQT